jgi:hypothetical protein
VTGADHDEDGNEPESVPWHHSTAKVLGASVAALAAIGLVVVGVTFMSRQADEPPPAPTDFVDPSFSQTATSATSTTSETITTTGPLVTSEIDDSTSVATTTSSTDTTTTSPEPTNSRPTHTSTGSDATTTTTRRGPRFNETRTLYPRP